jgi:hypothetical protein
MTDASEQEPEPTYRAAMERTLKREVAGSSAAARFQAPEGCGEISGARWVQGDYPWHRWRARSRDGPTLPSRALALQHTVQ